MSDETVYLSSRGMKGQLLRVKNPSLELLLLDDAVHKVQKLVKDFNLPTYLINDDENILRCVEHLEFNANND